jgi:hypothetical protein
MSSFIVLGTPGHQNRLKLVTLMGLFDELPITRAFKLTTRISSLTRQRL